MASGLSSRCRQIISCRPSFARCLKAGFLFFTAPSSNPSRSGGPRFGFWRISPIQWRFRHPQSGAFEMNSNPGFFRNALVSRAMADPVLKAALEAEDFVTGSPFAVEAGQSPLWHQPDYEAFLFDNGRMAAFDSFLEGISDLDRKDITAIRVATSAFTVVVVRSVFSDRDVELVG